MRSWPLLLVALLAHLGVAQGPDSNRAVPGATVSGIVRDSIARGPLAGAIVQLVAADSMARVGRTVSSDSLGRFAFGDVPAGRYTLGFFHPMLDSLGLEPTLREVSVAGKQPVRADLAIPSASRFRAAVCGKTTATDASAIVIGVVRDARGRAPAAGVTVAAEWLELSVSRQGLIRRVPRLVTTTASNGWFALCNAPSPGAITLIASHGADSTDFIEVQVPVGGFLRQELYLDAAGGERTGDGRLNGVVVTAAGGRPLPGARVSMSHGPQTDADQRGEWMLMGAPLGTRMLEVRAVGYYPERRVVDVLKGAEPIRSALSTMKAVLDTVHVTASRLDLNLRGFADRRHSGVGRYLTSEDVARRRPMVTSDLFRTTPGLRLEYASLGDTWITMRGITDDRCVPSVYIDGLYVSGLSADDIDSWVHPDEVAGIEIYAVGTVPAQYQPALSGCGSIVIWKKPRPAASERRSFKDRVLSAASLMVLALVLGAVLDRPH